MVILLMLLILVDQLWFIGRNLNRIVAGVLLIGIVAGVLLVSTLSLVT